MIPIIFFVVSFIVLLVPQVSQHVPGLNIDVVGLTLDGLHRAKQSIAGVVHRSLPAALPSASPLPPLDPSHYLLLILGPPIAVTVVLVLLLRRAHFAVVIFGLAIYAGFFYVWVFSFCDFVIKDIPQFFSTILPLFNLSSILLFLRSSYHSLKLSTDQAPYKLLLSAVDRVQRVCLPKMRNRFWSVFDRPLEAIEDEKWGIMAAFMLFLMITLFVWFMPLQVICRLLVRILLLFLMVVSRTTLCLWSRSRRLTGIFCSALIAISARFGALGVPIFQTSSRFFKRAGQGILEATLIRYHDVSSSPLAVMISRVAFRALAALWAMMRRSWETISRTTYNALRFSIKACRATTVFHLRNGGSMACSMVAGLLSSWSLSGNEETISWSVWLLKSLTIRLSISLAWYGVSAVQDMPALLATAQRSTFEDAELVADVDIKLDIVYHIPPPVPEQDDGQLMLHLIHVHRILDAVHVFGEPVCAEEYRAIPPPLSFDPVVHAVLAKRPLVAIIPAATYTLPLDQVPGSPASPHTLRDKSTASKKEELIPALTDVGNNTEENPSPSSPSTNEPSSDAADWSLKQEESASQDAGLSSASTSSDYLDSGEASSNEESEDDSAPRRSLSRRSLAEFPLNPRALSPIPEVASCASSTAPSSPVSVSSSSSVYAPSTPSPSPGRMAMRNGELVRQVEIGRARHAQEEYKVFSDSLGKRTAGEAAGTDFQSNSAVAGPSGAIRTPERQRSRTGGYTSASLP
ncbi:hypothetical protein B0H11DRAFT_2291437 [Mycena galericulata]|nr:hypothetical protein B0H11DRAFT_2291437 [Mycena galericulata]